MRAAGIDFFSRSAVKRWGTYLAKAAVLLGVLGLFSAYAATLPPALIAIVWALLSAAAAMGLVYHATVRKLHRQQMLKEGGRLARLNGGRVVSIATVFIVSAVCIAGLMLEVPKWDWPEWIAVVLAALAYPGIYYLVARFLRKEYEPLFSSSKAALWSCAIVGVLLCVFFGAMVFMQPAASYEIGRAHV